MAAAFPRRHGPNMELSFRNNFLVCALVEEFYFSMVSLYFLCLILLLFLVVGLTTIDTIL